MITLSIDSSDLKKLQRDLERMQAKLPQAIARGLNEGGDKVRTRVQRGMKEQTNVRAYKSVTSRMRTARAFAGGEGLAYQMIATGRGIPIAEFPVAVTSKGVDAKSWGVDHLFQRSFREKFTGKLRARVSGSRFPIRALYGPSLPKELGKGAIPGIFYAAAAEFVPPAIRKQLARAPGVKSWSSGHPAKRAVFSRHGLSARKALNA